MVICIDFDGTCVTHEFPRIGKNIGAEQVLRKLIDKKHQLVLFTMRSDIGNPKSNDYNIVAKGGNYLTEAVKWFKEHGIPLYGINTNPSQSEWTLSPKAYGQLYIDDAALGCPLNYNKDISDRPFVNWIEVERQLTEMNII